MPSTPAALRILFVEDRPEDAELEQKELWKAGIAFTAQRVDRRAELLRVLETWKPDLIISDYSLPDMDGPTVLAIARERAPDVPFIFCSGTIGEERAIESLKGGATDYVVKDRRGSLAAKVRRAVEERERLAEHRRLEGQLRQAQKMEAVGRLAGGIAHDFNNLLTVMNGYTELMMTKVPLGDPLREDLEEVLRAGDRAASLTRQLLAFSRKQLLAPVALNLNRVVGDMEKMLRRVLGEDIGIVTALDPTLGTVKADPGQLEQVVLNLAVNARDAMPNGGKLTIETRNVTIDEGYVREHPGAREGPHVLVAVSDTGVGMDAETQSHLFEPFFTTREPGKGTGLGLSTVYGIVKQSGGSVWVYSEPGKGATFKVYLPRVDEPVADAKPRSALPEMPRGTETVLLVEDSDSLRKLAEHLLGRSGYTVISTGDGEEALRRAREHAGPIHLLLSDVVLPEAGGAEVAHRIRLLRPGIKVLFTSGYTDRSIVESGVLDPGIAFLQKPFAAADLVRKVREVLDSRPL